MQELNPAGAAKLPQARPDAAPGSGGCGSLPARIRDRLGWRTVWAVIGVALLAVWGAWWGRNLYEGYLDCSAPGWFRIHAGAKKNTHAGAKKKRTPDPVCEPWFVRYPGLGIDFLNTYHAAEHWFDGGDPYRETYGPELLIPELKYEKFAYPPIVLRSYVTWLWLSPDEALRVWICLTAAAVALGALLAWRTRRELGLSDIPVPLAVAVVLWSTPVVFEMERGNCNALVLLLVAAGVWALRRSTHWEDVVAGLALAAATWVKVYPGLLAVGLLALGRWRALFYYTLAGLVMGLADLPNVVAWVNGLPAMREEITQMGDVIPLYAHSLSASWKLLWARSPLPRLGELSGYLAWAILFMPLIVWVSRPPRRGPLPGRLIYPYFLWLIAAGTFLPFVAWDYNLLFVPLAAVAVWDRRDPWYVHALMLPLLLWWQPVWFPIPPELFFGVKLLGVVGIGLSLRRRAWGFRTAQANLNAPSPF